MSGTFQEKKKPSSQPSGCRLAQVLDGAGLVGRKTLEVGRRGSDVGRGALLLPVSGTVFTARKWKGPYEKLPPALIVRLQNARSKEMSTAVQEV